MKNRKAFTLVELIAVIVIMGVILTIAVPNSLTMINRNKKMTLLSDAKNFVSLVKYQIKVDKDIEKPNSGEAIIITLGYLDTNDVEKSPYNNYYSKSQSFVLITADESEVAGEQVDTYSYYVHLVACNDETCESINNGDLNDRYGVVLSSIEQLSGQNRIELVKQGDETQAKMLEENTTINYLDGDYEIVEVYS